MTNAVDILCIGGAADGDMLCVKRAVATAYYARDIPYSHLVYRTRRQEVSHCNSAKVRNCRRLKPSATQSTLPTFRLHGT